MSNQDKVAQFINLFRDKGLTWATVLGLKVGSTYIPMTDSLNCFATYLITCLKVKGSENNSYQ